MMSAIQYEHTGSEIPSVSNPLCSVLHIESDSERKGGDASTQGLLDVNLGVDGRLADFMQLPLEGNASDSAIV